MSPAPIAEPRRLDLSPEQRAAVDARQRGKHLPADVKALAVAAIKAGTMTATEAAADLRVSITNVSDWCNGRSSAAGRAAAVAPADVVPEVVPREEPMPHRDRTGDRLRAMARAGAPEAQEGAEAYPSLAEPASAAPAPAGEASDEAEPDAEEGIRASVRAAGWTLPMEAEAMLLAEAGPAAIEAETRAATAEGREPDRARIIGPAVMAQAAEAAAREGVALGVVVHPAATLFPMLAGEAFAELVQDVRQHGVREPVTLDATGRLLDGRNRYAAAKLAGIECPTVIHTGTEAAAVALITSANMRRRHLDVPQRAMIAARLLIFAENSGAASRDAARATERRTAEAAGIGRATLQRAKVVAAQGTPEVQAAVEAGAVPIIEGAQIARQRAEAQAAALAEATKPKAPGSRSYAGTVAAERRKEKAEAQAEEATWERAAQSIPLPWIGDADMAEEARRLDGQGRAFVLRLLDLASDASATPDAQAAPRLHALCVEAVQRVAAALAKATPDGSA